MVYRMSWSFPRVSSVVLAAISIASLAAVQSSAQAVSADLRTPSESEAASAPAVVSDDSVATADLPDAPKPQLAVIETVAVDFASSAAGADQAPDAPAPAQAPAATQQPGQPDQSVQLGQSGQAKSQRELAEEQLKVEKKQRLGILPNFNASYVDNAVPLTPSQKFRLMFYTEKDPATFGFSMFIALIGQAEGSHSGYGGGIGGYGKRFGENYADTFDGAFWGNAVLPSLLHQDPRYFRLGQGTAMHRILYALSTNVRARHDGTQKWEPNYSNLFGNLISGGISNVYLPADERGVASTFEGALTVTAEGGVGSMLEEFWPDFLQYRQRRKARKLAARDAKENAAQTKTPATTSPSAPPQ
jgi:hypothetical protein